MWILSPNAGYGRVAHCVAMVMCSCMAFLPETEAVLRDLVFDVSMYAYSCTIHHMSICNYQLYAVDPQLSQH